METRIFKNNVVLTTMGRIAVVSQPKNYSSVNITVTANIAEEESEKKYSKQCDMISMKFDSVNFRVVKEIKFYYLSDTVFTIQVDECVISKIILSYDESQKSKYKCIDITVDINKNVDSYKEE